MGGNVSDDAAFLNLQVNHVAELKQAFKVINHITFRR